MISTPHIRQVTLHRPSLDLTTQVLPIHFLTVEGEVRSVRSVAYTECHRQLVTQICSDSSSKGCGMGLLPHLSGQCIIERPMTWTIIRQPQTLAGSISSAVDLDLGHHGNGLDLDQTRTVGHSWI